jgi:hypothetical protein
MLQVMTVVVKGLLRSGTDLSLLGEGGGDHKSKFRLASEEKLDGDGARLKYPPLKSQKYPEV